MVAVEQARWRHAFNATLDPVEKMRRAEDPQQPRTCPPPTRAQRWRRVARGGAALCAALLAVAALAMWQASDAQALRGEVHGWGGMPWGAEAEKAISNHKKWRGAYKAREVRKILETQDVILRGPTTLAGHSAAGQWIFSDKGLHTVVINWENNRAEAYGAWRDFLKALEGDWGEPSKRSPNGQELRWEGRWTRVKATRTMVATGSGVQVRLEALPAAFEATPPAGAGQGGGDKPREASPSKPTRRDDPAPARKTPTPPRDDDPFGVNSDDDDLGL